MKHGHEGTHYACDEMMKKHGGTGPCCECSGHECKTVEKDGFKFMFNQKIPNTLDERLVAEYRFKMGEIGMRSDWQIGDEWLRTAFSQIREDERAYRSKEYNDFLNEYNRGREDERAKAREKIEELEEELAFTKRDLARAPKDERRLLLWDIEKRHATGSKGRTWGDTDYDSEAVAFGYNEAMNDVMRHLTPAGEK